MSDDWGTMESERDFCPAYCPRCLDECLEPDAQSVRAPGWAGEYTPLRCAACGYVGGFFDEDDTDDYEEEYCQQCGAMLDDDAPPYSFDVIRRPYVTASGDLYCDVCGSAMDQAEEEAMDEDYFDEWYPGDYDMVEEESTEYYIGEGSEYEGDDDDD